MSPKKETAAPKEGGRGKVKILAMLVVVIVMALAYFFVLAPGEEPKSEEPVKGEVVSLEPIQLNLAEGHFLKIGVALQLSEDAHEIDGAQALDSIIRIYSGNRIEDVLTVEDRDKLREVLEADLDEAYHGEVIGVYYTDFVAQ